MATMTFAAAGGAGAGAIAVDADEVATASDVSGAMTGAQRSTQCACFNLFCFSFFTNRDSVFSRNADTPDCSSVNAHSHSGKILLSLVNF